MRATLVTFVAMAASLKLGELPRSPTQRKPGSRGYPDSVGFPDVPSWGWTKAPPKTSLVVEGTDASAAPWVLNLVQFVHWSPVVPAMLMAHAVLANAPGVDCVLRR